MHVVCTDCNGGNFYISVAAVAARNAPEYNSAKEKAHVQPRDASIRNRSNLPERTFTKWLAESAQIHQVCESGRPARRSRNLWLYGLPRRRDAHRIYQHDDARGNAVGRCALQQRQLSREEYSVRRKLRSRWRAAIDQDVSKADSG